MNDLKLNRFDIWIAPFLFAAICTGIVAHHSFFTYDTWWHISLGREILDTSNFHKDILSFTTGGVEIRNHAWLTDVIFALIDRNFGAIGLELLCGTIIYLILLALYYSSRCCGAYSLVALCACIIFLFDSILLLHLRPHIFTYLLFALLTLAVRCTLGWRRIFFAFVIFTLWANFHAAFVVGLVYIVLYICSALISRLLSSSKPESIYELVVIFLIGILASVIHPDGLSNFSNVLAHDPLALGINQYVNEWQPAEWKLVPVFYEAVIIGLILSIFQRPLPAPKDSIMFCAFAILGFSAWRHVPVFGVVGLPILAGWTSNTLRQLFLYKEERLDKIVFQMKHSSELRSVPVLICGLMAILIWRYFILCSPDWEQRRIAALKNFPVEAVNWIKQNAPCGKMFNQFEWGGYLGYILNGSYLVFIDSRIQPFLGVTISDYLIVVGLKEGWQDILAKYKINWIIIPASSPLAIELSLTASWEKGFMDNQAIIFVKHDCEHETSY